MTTTLPQAVDYLLSAGPLWAAPVLLFSAAVEYVFPPFPGDTVTLAGAVLASLGDWHLAWVFGVLLGGNLLGVALDYQFGKRFLTRERLDRSRRLAARRATVDRLLAGYRRYGPVLLVVNRFLPGFRALFFVAAGMAGLRLATVLFYAAVSAALWTGLLLLAGHLVGHNLALLESLLHRYFHVVWVLVLVVGLFFLWRTVRQRKSAP